MSPSKYVQQAVANCEQHLHTHFDGKYSLAKKAGNPFRASDNYEPELDVSEPLTPELASYFQSIIGVMRWMIEIGRVDIATEVSLLSSHLAMPREGHFEAALHVMSYLKCHHNTRLVFNPSYPNINHESFPENDWKEFYGSDIGQWFTPGSRCNFSSRWNLAHTQVVSNLGTRRSTATWITKIGKSSHAHRFLWVQLWCLPSGLFAAYVT